ncbi:MAG: hypothetical protein K2Y31_14215 [Burkholderiales bacterium]|jgi:hypothetical protein|nr:hypothetical protein [Burkholderiales bacterium]
MNLKNIIIQGGLQHRAVQDYDAQQERREYESKVIQSGVKRMEAQDSLLPEETEDRRATLQGKRQQRDHITHYQQLAATGASFEALAEAAKKRGDLASMKEFTTAQTNAEREGMKDVVIAALSGADDAELERIYNKSGQDRVDPGSVKMDRQTGFVSFSMNGEQKQVNMTRYAELLGIVKRPESKQSVVPAGAQLAVDGKIVATNTAGVEAKATADRQKLDYEYGLKRKLESFKTKHGEGKATALIQNMEYLVSSGVAADSKDAYAKLRTTMEKPEEDAILALATTLVKSPGYRGKDGLSRAMSDAAGMVKSVRSGVADPLPGNAGQPAQKSPYKSPEDVRAAFRAGTIDRAAAEAALRNDFGYQ